MLKKYFEAELKELRNDGVEVNEDQYFDYWFSANKVWLINALRGWAK